MSERRERQRSATVQRPAVTRPSATTVQASSLPASLPTSSSTPPDSAVPSDLEGRLIAERAPCALRIQREDRVTILPIAPGDRLVFGRHDAADVVFDDEGVSRLHGVLSVRDGQALYEDYGSQNGTRRVGPGVDVGVVPRTPTVVVAGDVLVFGPHSEVRLLAELPLEQRTRRHAGTEESRAARMFTERLRLASRTRVPVFLLGDSGVGKTHSARRLHELSRLPGPFVPVNCARLPTEPTALHSELLGHVRGAYTGADATRVGKLVLADGGTLFLDEVESLPVVAQGFLLDVLEGTGDLAPLGAGGTRLKPIAFRLVSASKRPLATSGLRADLAERLAEGHLWRVPGLEDRVDDIPGLMQRFAEEQGALLGVEVALDDTAIRFCQRVRWPGQVRMLRATIVALAQLGLARHLESSERVPPRAVSRSPTTTRTAGQAVGVVRIGERDVEAHLAERAAAFGVVEVEPSASMSAATAASTPPRRGDARRLSPAQAQAALQAAGGNLSAAAAALGVARNTLRKKLQDDGAG